VIRKFCRNLLLRGLILAFTGDQAASVLDEAPQAIEPSAAVTAMQALDQLNSGWSVLLLPVTAYEIVRGAAF
jgi:hypothetical protein